MTAYETAPADVEKPERPRDGSGDEAPSPLSSVGVQRTEGVAPRARPPSDWIAALRSESRSRQGPPTSCAI